MTNIVLPKLNQTGANEWADVQDNDEAIKKVVNGELDNGNLRTGAGIVAAKLASIGSEIKGFSVGSKSASEDLTLTSSYQDVPGASLEITPTVESKLIVLAAYNFTFTEHVQGFKYYGTLKVDSGSEQSNVAKLGGNNASFEATVFQPYVLTLSAAKHTINMRAKGEVNAAASPKVLKTNTGFVYLLLAA